MSLQQSTLTVRRFVEADFPVYQAWFANEQLHRQLGPVDEEWLTHVLTDVEGEQWSFFVDDELVAVVGLVPDQDNNAWVISDFAVDPARRRQGWGRRAWETLLALPARMQRINWRAYVAADNLQAQAFFDALGWLRLMPPSSGDPYWAFAWRLGRT